MHPNLRYHINLPKTGSKEMGGRATPDGMCVLGFVNYMKSTAACRYIKFRVRQVLIYNAWMIAQQ